MVNLCCFNVFVEMLDVNAGKVSLAVCLMPLRPAFRAERARNLEQAPFLR